MEGNNKQINQRSAAKETETKGELTFEDKVIQKIVGHALEDLSGLLGIDGGFFSNVKNKLVNSENFTEGISVEVGKTQVAVDLNITIEYGYNAHKIYEEMVKIIAKDLEKVTELELVELNVKVIDIQNKEDFEAGQVSLQDKIEDAGSSIKDKISSNDSEDARDKDKSDNRVK